MASQRTTGWHIMRTSMFFMNSRKSTATDSTALRNLCWKPLPSFQLLRSLFPRPNTLFVLPFSSITYHRMLTILFYFVWTQTTLVLRYSTVYTYCTAGTAKRTREAQLGGGDLYGRLRDFLKKYIKNLNKVREA